jgi:hypothetical protein
MSNFLYLFCVINNQTRSLAIIIGHNKMKQEHDMATNNQVGDMANDHCHIIRRFLIHGKIFLSHGNMNLIG